MKYLNLAFIIITQFAIIKISHEAGRLDGMNELLDKIEKDMHDLTKNKIDEE